MLGGSRYVHGREPRVNNRSNREKSAALARHGASCFHRSTRTARRAIGSSCTLVCDWRAAPRLRRTARWSGHRSHRRAWQDRSGHLKDSHHEHSLRFDSGFTSQTRCHRRCWNNCWNLKFQVGPNPASFAGGRVPRHRRASGDEGHVLPCPCRPRRSASLARGVRVDHSGRGCREARPTERQRTVRRRGYERGGP